MTTRLVTLAAAITSLVLTAGCRGGNAPIVEGSRTLAADGDAEVDALAARVQEVLDAERQAEGSLSLQDAAESADLGAIAYSIEQNADTTGSQAEDTGAGGDAADALALTVPAGLHPLASTVLQNPSPDWRRNQGRCMDHGAVYTGSDCQCVAWSMRVTSYRFPVPQTAVQPGGTPVAQRQCPKVEASLCHCWETVTPNTCGIYGKGIGWGVNSIAQANRVAGDDGVCWHTCDALVKQNRTALFGAQHQCSDTIAIKRGHAVELWRYDTATGDPVRQAGMGGTTSTAATGGQGSAGTSGVTGTQTSAQTTGGVTGGGQSGTQQTASSIGLRSLAWNVDHAIGTAPFPQDAYCRQLYPSLQFDPIAPAAERTFRVVERIASYRVESFINCTGNSYAVLVEVERPDGTVIRKDATLANGGLDVSFSGGDALDPGAYVLRVRLADGGAQGAMTFLRLSTETGLLAQP